ncbi:MAG: ABC transporter permease [Chloroflexi bacterium]|nr:ABC transporter permease [Chloroflexota bacterium]
MRRVVALVRKEFLQIGRDRRTLAMILVLPAMQLLLFGYAINTTVDHIPAVVLDQVQDRSSRAFVAALQNSGYFDVAGQVQDVAQVRQAVDQGTARAGFIIPPEFSRNLLAGRPAQVQVVIDGSDPNYAQTVLFAATTVGQARSAELLAARLERLGRGRPTGELPIELRPTVLYNPSIASATFMIPGLIGLILQFQTLILTTFALVRERERGTLEQLLVTPIKPWELMAGKLIPYTVLAFANITVALAFGIFWFQVEFAGNLLLFLALSVVFLFSSLGTGLFVSTVSQTQGQAIQTTLFLLLPSILLSGFVFPREAMPLPLHDLGYLIPLTYFLKILRGIVLKGVGLDALWGEVWPLALFGVVVFTLSALRFRKQLA